MPDMETNGWGEWRRHVLIQLEEQTKAIKEQNERINALDRDLVMLKVKSSIWGAVAGAVTVVLGLAVTFLGGLLRQ